jgi:hypothetical protein
MEHVWTWGGIYFGFLERGELWTHDGRHVGRCMGSEIYGETGHYLGEIAGNHRLVAVLTKKAWTADSFLPWPRRTGVTPYGNYVAFAMETGREDFPAPGSVA